MIVQAVVGDQRERYLVALDAAVQAPHAEQHVDAEQDQRRRGKDARSPRPAQRHGEKAGIQHQKEGDAPQAEHRCRLDHFGDARLAIGEGTGGAVGRADRDEVFPRGPQRRKGEGGGKGRQALGRKAGEHHGHRKGERRRDHEHDQRKHRQLAPIGHDKIGLAHDIRGERGDGDVAPWIGPVGEPQDGQDSDPGECPDLADAVREIEAGAAQRRAHHRPKQHHHCQSPAMAFTREGRRATASARWARALGPPAGRIIHEMARPPTVKTKDERGNWAAVRPVLPCSFPGNRAHRFAL